MSAGWYRMHRGWQNDPLFAGDKFSRRDAWEWLICNAAWEAHSQWFNGHRILVERGQLVTSERDLCEAWKWDRQRVRTFLRHLEIDEKLTRSADRSATKLTVCNYEKYQTEQPTEKPAAQPTPNPELTQSQPTTEEEKEGKEEKNLGGGKPPKSDYAFFGRTIRLKPSDLERWRRTYHAITDMDAELTALDAWWEEQPAEKRKKWFHPTVGMLNRKHQENLSARATYDKDRITV